MTDALTRLNAPQDADRPVRTEPPARLREAAVQFETLLIAQLLKSAREGSGEGWLGSGESAAGETASAVAEEHVARALAAAGGLGMASLITAGMVQKDAAEPAVDAPTPPARLPSS